MHESIKREAVFLIERDGPVVQGKDVDSFEKLVWTPKVFSGLGAIARQGAYRLVLFVNESKIDETALAVHKRIEQTLAGEGIVFDDVCFTEEEVKHFSTANAACSVVLSCEPSRLARLLGWQEAIFSNWEAVLQRYAPDSLSLPMRIGRVHRQTKETTVDLTLNLDGSGNADIDTSLPFFDHMLQQIARHGHLDMAVHAQGDIELDEHHTVEDVAIVLGEAVRTALGEKRGISRYGFEILPMDECLAQVAIDFSGRPYLKWHVNFNREFVGTFPTELFSHFFKSFSDEARCTLHMEACEGNAHHQAEALFKAFGRALRAAAFRYPTSKELPSTKGML